ncbi:MAG: ABC-F type ribosomal protection protein [Erysipelotrichaceae bacterium]|jgi:lincosamide and streptogramin A transport system ATP-binding/permease protein|nr:ABC-F type ribosomal protection protein [Erysipelotrichaceae bacterium]
MLIDIQNLSFSFDDGTLVFDRVSFRFDTSWKLGFTGRNGRGKTTFLKILLGQLDYTGKINSPVGFSYFPFTVKEQNQSAMEVIHSISPQAFNWQIIKECSLLEVQEEALERPFTTLSQGERTKVLIAALFLMENQFLLLDEPSSHLDLKGQQILMDYLKGKQGFILVSHNRKLLDGATDHTLSLNKASIDLTQGSYSVWQKEKEKQVRFEQEKNKQLKKEIKVMEKAARRTAGWSDQVEASKTGNGPVDRGYIGHQAAKMMKRAKSIEHRQKQAIKEKQQLLQDEEIQVPLKMNPMAYHSKLLVYAKDLVLYYDHKAVTKPLNFELYQSERIAVSGPNGSGKSTLFKKILGQEIESTGILKVGNLIISYLPQSTGSVNGSLLAFAKEQQVDYTTLLGNLNRLGFLRKELEHNLQQLSEGQKKKVLIAKSLCESAHLYLWDEPFNYVDLPSRLQLEELILKMQPTLMVIEHDQAFMEKVATKVLVLE